MRHILIAALMLSGVPGLAGAQNASTDMTEAERAVFRSEVRAYLLDNPEVIMEAINLLRQQEEAKAAESDRNLVVENSEALYSDDHSWVGGNPEGPITLVEFLDYQCGYCKAAHADIARLVAENPDLRLIVKELPILGPVSDYAARHALAVLGNDGPATYRRFADAMMTFEGRLSERAVDSLAEKAGADVPAMKAAAQGDRVAQSLEANLALAEALRISGTPTFVLGGEMLRGALPYADLKDLVDQTREGL
jgi:protein-disulfide isomerase